MKGLFVVPLIFLLVGTICAQNREIVFEHETLAAVMIKAKANGKMVFVDCYTEWCGPCKYMASNVFRQDSVADFFNAHLINLKVDMEKGEGPSMRKRYRVGAYPTYLLLKDNGELIYKFVGGMEAADFLRKIREGMQPDNRIATMLHRYEAGDRSNQLMRDYIWEALKMKEGPKAQELSTEYFNILTRTQRTENQNWFLFGENTYSRELSDMRSSNFNYLIENWKDFAAVQGKETVDDKISGVFRRLTRYCLRGYYQKTFGYNKSDFDIYRKQINGTATPDKQNLLVMMDIAQAACEKDSVKVLNLLADQIGGFTSKNIDIAFDFFAMFPAYRKMQFSRWTEICDAVIAHSQNINLVHHAQSYK